MVTSLVSWFATTACLVSKFRAIAMGFNPTLTVLVTTLRVRSSTARVPPSKLATRAVLFTGLYATAMGCVPTATGWGSMLVLLFKSTSEMLFPFKFATMATLCWVSMATALGLLPTATVARTAAPARSTIETLLLPKLVTTARLVVGLIATLVGPVPTVTVFLIVLLARSTIETELLFRFTTTRVFVWRLMSEAKGPLPTGNRMVCPKTCHEPMEIRPKRNEIFLFMLLPLVVPLVCASDLHLPFPA